MKYLIWSSIIFIVLLLLGYFALIIFFKTPSLQNSNFIFQSFLFQGIASVSICFFIFILATFNKYKNYLGLVYLLFFVLKLVAFLLLFKKIIISQNSLTTVMVAGFILPLIVALIFEVVFTTKTINKNTY